MMAVWNLSESRIDEELLARGSRISGTREQKQDRLYRFLEFENQKERRNQYVKQVKAEKKKQEEEAVLECYEGCPCNYGNKEEETQAVQNLMNLYDAPINTEVGDDIEILIGENRRLNERINNLENRLSALENEVMPALIPESNPQWMLDTAMYT